METLRNHECKVTPEYRQVSLLIMWFFNTYLRKDWEGKCCILIKRFKRRVSVGLWELVGSLGTLWACVFMFPLCVSMFKTYLLIQCFLSINSRQ